MATLAEIADHIEGVRNKYIQEMSNVGWALDHPISHYMSYGPEYNTNVLLDYISFTAERVRSLSNIDLQAGQLGKFLAGIDSAVQILSLSALRSNPASAVNNVLMTMQMINARLPTHPKGPVKIDWESIEDKTLLPKDLSRRLNGVAARLAALEPRASEIDQKISDIEAAHETAEQLPEDLAELAAKRDQVSSIVSDAETIELT